LVADPREKVILKLMKQLYAVCFTLGFILLTATGLKAQFNTILRAGNSYVNITKGTVGGAVEPGDVLEIRTNVSSQVLTTPVATSTSPVTWITFPLKHLTWFLV
jgi:hypothetical protein